MYILLQGARGDPGPIGAVGFSGPPVSIHSSIVALLQIE